MTIQELVSQMTLEEKAGMCSGKDTWHLKGIQRLNIPSVCVTDGPHGLRKQQEGGDHLGIGGSVPATAFPTAAALASSFDRALVERVGRAIGEECQKENVAVVLGPGANIKRSPLCGRNFEYFSEDPLLSGEMAAAHIRGVQSRGVGTSLKHYCMNNQETCRLSSNSVADERTMREIYLASFEFAVKGGKPWTVMCSYNRVNGTYACENPFILTQVLRDEWGFDGYVVTDWGAMHDKVESIKAGLELQMPGPVPDDDQILVDAVKNGDLDEEILDRAVERILNITFRACERHIEDATFSTEEHDRIARETEADCAVLLKNPGILPLARGANIAILGPFAKTPRYQGGGSSHINPLKVTTALDAVGEYTDRCAYAEAYRLDGTADAQLMEEALAACEGKDAIVLFAGLPDAFESEGYDRTHIFLPENQVALIAALLETRVPLCVVLANGSPVFVPYADAPYALLESYLGGQASGGAVMDVLFGKVNPSGRLAETFPRDLAHNPSYLNFAGEHDVEYREGVFVGYRYYVTKRIPTLFPFGFGLSYTSFEYSNLRLDRTHMRADEVLNVSVDVTNTGKCKGKEVVQLYVRPVSSTVMRPVLELRGFDKVELEQGETKTVSFALGMRAFAYWETALSDWHVEGGTYEILIAKNCEDIALCAPVEIEQIRSIPIVYTMNSPLSDVIKHPQGKAFVEKMVYGFMQSTVGEGGGGGMGLDAEGMFKMVASIPLRAMVGFSRGAFTKEQAQSLIDMLNA
jgi:beta-glucosidase